METIAIWFSCGAASAVAAKKTFDKYKDSKKILIVNNPVKEEHKDNLRFKDDVENWVGHEILEAKSKKYPNASIVDVFNDRRYMSGVQGAPCTKFLKKQARYEFELSNNIDWHVLGFTFEEKNRHNNFVKRERSNVIPTLINKEITKGRCFEILQENKIKLPEIYKLGYPNANCVGCVKSTGVSYWNLVRKTFPEVFKERCEQSREIGTKLVRVKGKRIYLDELKTTDKGQRIKSWECGLFCDTE